MPDGLGARSKAGNGSLVHRLVRTAVLWALPILLICATILTLYNRNTTYRIFDDPQQSAISALIAAVNVNSDGGLNLASQPLDPRYQRALSGRYWLIGTLQSDGAITTLMASRSLFEEALALDSRAAQRLIEASGAPISARTTGPDNEPLRVVARYVTLPNMESQPVVILAAADERPASQAVRRFAVLAITLLGLLSLGLLAAIYLQVRLGLKPLFDLREQVAGVREGRATRVDGVYPTEIQPLASELNSLIDHNKNIVERAQTHVGNLAHALKTPIAVLLNESESKQGSDPGLADIVGRQVETMRKQVDHHLHRARAAARGQTIGVSSPVEDIIASLARTLPRIYRDKDIDITLEIEPGLAFRGEKRDLDELVGNLMDNACKWTESRVRVRAVRHATDEGLMIITVEDDGPGMKVEDFETAVKRGTRLDEATPGTGFGLAIVDDLARAYKGALNLSASSMGGLSAALTLPRRIDG